MVVKCPEGSGEGCENVSISYESFSPEGRPCEKKAFTGKPYYLSNDPTRSQNTLLPYKGTVTSYSILPNENNEIRFDEKRKCRFTKVIQLLFSGKS
jgi:hypothetical protein